jgi:hypothetical protein
LIVEVEKNSSNDDSVLITEVKELEFSHVCKIINSNLSVRPTEWLTNGHIDANKINYQLKKILYLSHASKIKIP